MSVPMPMTVREPELGSSLGCEEEVMQTRPSGLSSAIFRIESDIFYGKVAGPVSANARTVADSQLNSSHGLISEGRAGSGLIKGNRFACVEQGESVQLQPKMLMN